MPPQRRCYEKTIFIWQRGGCGMNIWSGKKRLEKLTSMHNNPVKRGWVAEPGDWAVVELALL